MIELVFGLALAVLDVAIAPYLPVPPAAEKKLETVSRPEVQATERWPAPTNPARRTTYGGDARQVLYKGWML